MSAGGDGGAGTEAARNARRSIRVPDIEMLSRLRSEEKGAILDAILGMVFADGTVQEEEVYVVRRYAAHLSDVPVEDLIATYQPDLARVGRRIASSDLGPSGRHILIRGMALVAASSGDLDEGEVNFYNQCLRAFGVSPSQQKQIEKTMARYMYGDLVSWSLARGHGDLSAYQGELAEGRARLGIAADEAQELEKHARIEYRFESEA